MRPFVQDLALAYLAFTFLVTGTFHAVRFGRLRRLVASHQIVPAGLTAVASAGLVGLELIVGFASVVGVIRAEVDLPFVGLSFFAGLAFVAYVRRLLRGGGSPTSCGCSPVGGGAVTGASLVPALALLAVAAAALFVDLAGGVAAEQASGGPAGRALSVGWGLLLAWTVMLVPAIVPQPQMPREESWTG